VRARVLAFVCACATAWFVAGLAPLTCALGFSPSAFFAAAPGVVPVMVRLSNILSVESRPFDPDTHSLEGEAYIDEAGQRQARHALACVHSIPSLVSLCVRIC
jgi:hypothetical protein